MPTNENRIEDDPNASTENEKRLKRVEIAIRRRVRSDLLLMLDGIAHMNDAGTQMRELKSLKRELES